MVKKMLNKLGRKMEEHTENLRVRIEKNQTEMKNTITEMKNILGQQSRRQNSGSHPSRKAKSKKFKRV